MLCGWEKTHKGNRSEKMASLERLGIIFSFSFTRESYGLWLVLVLFLSVRTYNIQQVCTLSARTHTCGARYADYGCATTNVPHGGHKVASLN